VGTDDRPCSRIPLNPVKVKAAKGVEAAELWKMVARCPWSSARGYLDEEHSSEMVDYRWVKSLGGGSITVGRKRYAEYLRGFLVQDDEEILKAMSAGVYAIGDEEFRQEMDAWVREQGKRRKSISDLAMPGNRVVSMAEIERVVARECGLKVADLKRKSARIGVAREFLAELGCSVGGLTQRAMAEHLGTVTEHAVGKARRSLSVRLAKDAGIRGRWGALKKTMSTF
jgi:DNA-binding transcriptional ArsR family regulator